MAELAVYDGDPTRLRSPAPVSLAHARPGHSSGFVGRAIDHGGPTHVLDLGRRRVVRPALVPAGGCIAEVPSASTTSMRDGRVFLTLIRTQVAARSIGAPAMPSVPGNRTNQACLSHPWSEM
jgi:hypothetical protein